MFLKSSLLSLILRYNYNTYEYEVISCYNESKLYKRKGSSAYKSMPGFNFSLYKLALARVMKVRKFNSIFICPHKWKTCLFVFTSNLKPTKHSNVALE